MTDDGTFYLTLPSNSSMKHYPHNKNTHYHTRLPQDIRLEGEYEVGLSEIMFSNNFFNVQEDECWMKVRNGKWDRAIPKLTVKAGRYNEPREFIENLNSLVESNTTSKSFQSDGAGVVFYYFPYSKRVGVTVKSGALLQLSKTLKSILNIEDNADAAPNGQFLEVYHGPKDIKSEGAVTLHRGLDSVYVYCDLIEPRIVGDVFAPLLRTIPSTTLGSDIVHFIYQKPVFVKAAKQTFQSCEILLVQDTGQELSLDGGKTVVTLQFRKRRPDHF